jgi:hypothetical protein
VQHHRHLGSVDEDLHLRDRIVAGLGTANALSSMDTVRVVVCGLAHREIADRRSRPPERPMQRRAPSACSRTAATLQSTRSSHCPPH